MNVTLVTGRKAKLAELQAIFPPNIHVTLKDLDVPEYQGEPDYVAIEKCQLATSPVNGPTITEDTSLCFNALGGLPGAYIKEFVEISSEGLYTLLTAFEDKSAYALCTYAFCLGPGHPVQLYQGRTEGTIVEPRGISGFNKWDNCFQPAGYELTYGEMSADMLSEAYYRVGAQKKLCDALVAIAESGHI